MIYDRRKYYLCRIEVLGQRDVLVLIQLSSRVP